MERWKRAIALEPDWNSPKEKLAELVKYLVFVSDLVTGKDRVRSGTVLCHEKSKRIFFPFIFFPFFPADFPTTSETIGRVGAAEKSLQHPQQHRLPVRHAS